MSSEHFEEAKIRYRSSDESKENTVQCVKKLIKARLDYELEVHRLLEEHKIYNSCDGKEMMIDDVLEECLTIIGVPEDNTVETRACDYANSVGDWPDWGYCRDSWLREWDDLLQGEVTLDEFVEEMVVVSNREEGNDYPTTFQEAKQWVPR